VRLIAITVNAAVIAAAALLVVNHNSKLSAQVVYPSLTVSAEEKTCLAKNIFFESRNQPVNGQKAVAWVTLNRVEHSRYPDTICGVVKQAKRDAEGRIIKYQCQFSWYCDGKPDTIPSNSIAQEAWARAQQLADQVLLSWAENNKSPVGNATMFHADYVTPYWTNSYNKVMQIGDHVFYQQ
jgi:spore germination cell wall hydrolase CwlJ-like protein